MANDLDSFGDWIWGESAKDTEGYSRENVHFSQAQRKSS